MKSVIISEKTCKKVVKVGKLVPQRSYLVEEREKYVKNEDGRQWFAQSINFPSVRPSVRSPLCAGRRFLRCLFDVFAFDTRGGGMHPEYAMKIG